NGFGLDEAGVGFAHVLVGVGECSGERAASPSWSGGQLGMPGSQRARCSLEVLFGLADGCEERLGLSTGFGKGGARVRDGISTRGGRYCGGEEASLGDGGDVGALVGERLFKHIPRVLGTVGDDEEPVLVATSGGGDVEAAVCGRGGDDGKADVDGVGLVAVGGGGVAEPDMLAGVVGGQGDGAVSVKVRHGYHAIMANRGDLPEVAVADRFTPVGALQPVVAASHDDVAWVRCLTSGDTGGTTAELAAVEASLLDRGVERVDVFVGLVDDGDAAPGCVVRHPCVSRVLEKLVKRAGRHAAVIEVGVEGAGVAGA